jgi:hypothetical protein
MGDQVSHPHKTTDPSTVLYILSFFNRKTEDSGPSSSKLYRISFCSQFRYEWNVDMLGLFPNLRNLRTLKGFTSSFMVLSYNFGKRLLFSSRLSVCPQEITRLLLEGYSLNLKFEYFSKICPENSSSIKTGQEKRVLYNENRYTFLIISRSVLLTAKNVSDKSCTDNQNTHFVFSNFFFENRVIYEIIWKKNIF